MPAPNMDIEELARQVPDGANVALFKDPHAPMALLRELIRQGRRGLELVTIPAGAFPAEVLIAAGCVASVETSGISLGEFGPAPAFTAAVETGALSIRDSSCPAIYAQLQAGEKGQPFTCLRGLVGSDVVKHRDDIKIIDNPYPPHDPVTILPPLTPEFALIHAAIGDSHGNVWIGRQPELKVMAHAARVCLVTVEKVIDGNLLEDAKYGAAAIPAFYVSGLAEAPKGAWPVGFPDYYPRDEAHLTDYARRAHSAEGRAAYIAEHIIGAEAAE